MGSLRLLAEIQGKNVTAVMEPHKEVLQDMIPPKKHLLRHQPVNAQIGLMDGNTFCTTLEPRLFTIDLKVLALWGCSISFSLLQTMLLFGANGFIWRGNTVWGGDLLRRFCNMFSKRSPCLLGQHGSFAVQPNCRWY